MATPKLSFDKGPRQYYARFNGRKIYLGKDYTQAAQKFAEALARHENGDPVGKPTSQDSITVVEASAQYIDYAKRHYAAGTEEPRKIRLAMQRLGALYGREALANLSPRKLKTFQSHLVQQGELSRSTINETVQYVRRFLRWAVSEELIPASVYEAARCVEPLRMGRTTARETDPIKPGPLADVEAVKAVVASPVRALIDLQILTASRPGELLGLRPQDIDATGDIWTARLPRHKNAWRGHDRILLFGPKAQAVLRPFLLRGEDEFLFSPKEAVQERKANAKTPRRPDQPESARQTSRRVGMVYNKDSYRRAIQRGCEQAGVPKWAPNQLRHNAATLIRQSYGLEAAGAILGHAELETSQIYAEKNKGLAREIISQIG